MLTEYIHRSSSLRLVLLLLEGSALPSDEDLAILNILRKREKYLPGGIDDTASASWIGATKLPPQSWGGEMLEEGAVANDRFLSPEELAALPEDEQEYVGGEVVEGLPSVPAIPVPVLVVLTKDDKLDHAERVC